MADNFSYSDDNLTEISEITPIQSHQQVVVKKSVHNEHQTDITTVGSFIRTKIITEDSQKREVTTENIINTQEAETQQKKDVLLENILKMQGTTLEDATTAHAEKKFAPVTHVIFDLDGTLLDTESINNQIITEIAREYGKEYSADIQSQVLGRIASDASIAAVRLMNIPITAEEFDARVQIENVKRMKNAELMPGAEKLIKHLRKKKIPIAIATSSAKSNYELKCSKHTELFSSFNHVVNGGSDQEVIVGKPAPDIYLVCASRFPDKPEPRNCLAIEDSPNGVKSAFNAGMQVVMIPSPLTAPELCKEATLVLKSMEEFKPELFGLPEFEDEEI